MTTPAPNSSLPQGALTDALIDIARAIEALKQECGMDPESPRAIQNGRYMSIAYRVRALASAQPAPQGWKLVPVEPTDEMLSAGQDAQNRAVYRRPQPVGKEWGGVYYRAMIAAAPSLPPAGDGSGMPSGGDAR